MNDYYFINGKKVWNKKPLLPFLDSYKKASDKERVLLQKFFSAYDIIDYQFTLSESFDSYEATFTYAGKSYITETKNRNVTSNFYKSGLIEEFKYNYLTAVTSASTVIPIYINFYTDSTFRIWNLRRQYVFKDLDWRNQLLLVSGIDINIGYIEKAAVFCGIVAEKKDPKAEERKEKQDTLTFGEHFSDYLQRYSMVHKKSWKYDKDEVNRYLAHWFNKKLSEIKRSDVEKLHERIGKENGRVQANTILKRLSSIYNKAIEWDWKGENPTTGIKKFKEISRDRFIQPHEMPYIDYFTRTDQSFHWQLTTPVKVFNFVFFECPKLLFFN